MKDHQLLFPSSINKNHELLYFIDVSYSELNELPFHDSRLNQQKKITKNIDLVTMSDEKIHQSSYIFHTAFCGSTYLSKLLGNTEKFMAIREPNIFMELANMKRVNEDVKNNKKLLGHLINKTLSAFPKKEDHRLLFKPTNATNNIIKELINGSSECKAIFLYLELNDFLISIIKKGEAGRSFIRNLYNIFSLDSSPYAITDFRQVNGLTDLQIACMVWSMQMYEYQKFYQSGDDIMFLNADQFLDNPESNITIIAQFLGKELTQEDIDHLNNKGLFKKHSKFKGQAYTTDIRNKEKQLIEQKFNNELKTTQQWVKKAIQLPRMPPTSKHIKV